MPAFRILNQFPVYRGADDLPLVGGTIRFYESNTTTPKSVYGGPDLTPDNGPVIALGTDGRPEVDIWGNGVYRVRLYDADGTLVPGCEVDDVEIPGGDATTIPVLVDGYFLSNNGALLLWVELRQLPDPTGQDGKMVVADGDGYILQSIPEPPEPVDPDIVVGAGPSLQAGTSDEPTKFKILSGSDSAPASGSKVTSKIVEFDPPFSTTPRVFPVNRSGFVTQSGDIMPTVAITAVSPTQFTVQFCTQVGEGNSDANIISAVNFDWVAFGFVEVEPEEEP